MARSKSKHIRQKSRKKQAWKARRKRQKAAKKTTKK
ncbi:MAG: aminopeptidase [Deltaproteobacteria bacterium]